MSAAAVQKGWAGLMLGIDPETITEVRPVLSKAPVIDGVVLRGVRWSNVIISTGDRVGYSEETPGVLYVLGSASR